MTKEIELTQGKIALVDDKDYANLASFNWTALRYSNNNFYAARNSKTVNGERHTISMHRQILGLEYGDGLFGDHINRVTLDNRRSNLRIVNKTNNNRNHGGFSHNTSGHNGVSWHNQNRCWQAQITVNKKYVYLGTYDNIDDAITARKQGELKHWHV